jgi:hypothetical protein
MVRVASSYWVRGYAALRHLTDCVRREKRFFGRNGCDWVGLTAIGLDRENGLWISEVKEVEFMRHVKGQIRAMTDER